MSPPKQLKKYSPAERKIIACVADVIQFIERPMREHASMHQPSKIFFAARLVFPGFAKIFAISNRQYSPAASPLFVCWGFFFNYLEHCGCFLIVLLWSMCRYVLSTKYLTPSCVYQVLSTKWLVQRTWYQELGTTTSRQG